MEHGCYLVRTTGSVLCTCVDAECVESVGVVWIELEGLFPFSNFDALC